MGLRVLESHLEVLCSAHQIETHRHWADSSSLHPPIRGVWGSASDAYERALFVCGAAVAGAELGYVTSAGSAVPDLRVTGSFPSPSPVPEAWGPGYSTGLTMPGREPAKLDSQLSQHLSTVYLHQKIL